MNLNSVSSIKEHEIWITAGLESTDFETPNWGKERLMMPAGKCDQYSVVRYVIMIHKHAKRNHMEHHMNITHDNFLQQLTSRIFRR